MYIEKIPLQIRFDMLTSGCCAHQEYIVAEIYRFAGLPVMTYFDGMPNELFRLEQLLDIPHKAMQDMTYMQLVNQIDTSIQVSESGRLCEIMNLLSAPLAQAYNGQSEHGDKHQIAPETNKPQRISLNERLKNNISLGDCVILNMDVQDFLPFLDGMVSPSGTHFEHIYDRFFQGYRHHTFISLIAESVQLPEEQRRDIQYNLLIHPFVRLNNYPKNK